MSSEKMHGEGNKEAAKDYNEKTREFIEDGKVKQAADNAEPDSSEKKKEIEQAEKAAANRENSQKSEGASS